MEEQIAKFVGALKESEERAATRHQASLDRGLQGLKEELKQEIRDSMVAFDEWRPEIDAKVSELDKTVADLRKQVDRLAEGVGAGALGAPPVLATPTTATTDISTKLDGPTVLDNDHEILAIDLATPTPASCSTLDPDHDASDIVVLAVSLLMEGMFPFAPALTTVWTAQPRKSFIVRELDSTMMPTRCLKKGSREIPYELALEFVPSAALDPQRPPLPAPAPKPPWLHELAEELYGDNLPSHGGQLLICKDSSETTRGTTKSEQSAELSMEGDGGEEGVEVATLMVVFVNAKSGGRHGPELKVRLHELISKEQVFDLSVVKPSDFVRYGLGCLERLADQGDNCAKDIRGKLRIMVAGGDDTVGWVLGCLQELNKLKREPVPPTGIIPLGTGNDLARSFGWGGIFPLGWRSAVKRYLSKAGTAPIVHLDSWQAVIIMPEGEITDLPHALKKVEPTDQLEFSKENGSELPRKPSCYKGVFCNYLSIGMDAQVAYGFHHLRDEKPYLAQGPVANKLIYAGYSCTQGWFCTPCTASPQLRGLWNILRLYIKRANCSEWEQIQMPSSVRSLVVLNLYNYGSGRHPWGDLKPDYLEKRGFVEAHSDDGLIEIFGLKEGWHASLVMAELIKAKHIAQAAAIKFEMRESEWDRAYLQMDGEELSIHCGHAVFQGGRIVTILAVLVDHNFSLDEASSFDLAAFIDHVYYLDTSSSFDLIQVHIDHGYYREGYLHDSNRSKDRQVPWDPGGNPMASAWGQAEFQGGRIVSDPYPSCHRLGLGPW